MDTEFSWTQGPPETNSIMATTITRLTEAEEKRWRQMLALAWAQGYSKGADDHHNCGPICEVSTEALNPFLDHKPIPDLS